MLETGLRSRVSYHLNEEEKITVTVQFEPDLSGEKECRTVFGMLKLLYHEHPKQVRYFLQAKVVLL